MQRSARAEGEREFARGVGRRIGEDDVALRRAPTSDAIERRRRKTRSAYVSRYAAKQYARLLEEHVRSEDAEVARMRQKLAADTKRIVAARELLMRLEADAANRGPRNRLGGSDPWPDAFELAISEKRNPIDEGVRSTVSSSAFGEINVLPMTEAIC